MSIDWSATGTMLQGWGTLIGALAVIYAAKKGADTFEGWKQQKVTERRLEQAERILTATYRGRRALAYVRGVMMWGHELSAAEEKLKESPTEWSKYDEQKQRRLVTVQAYYNRLNRTKDEQQERDMCLPMARALFGEELEKAIEKLNHQFWIVQVDVDSYLDDNGQDQDFTKKIRRGMYDVKARQGETNELSDAIAGAVATIEAICLPALRLETKIS